MVTNCDEMLHIEYKIMNSPILLLQTDGQTDMLKLRVANLWLLWIQDVHKKWKVVRWRQGAWEETASWMKLNEEWSIHVNENLDFGLVGNDILRSGRCLPVFWRNILPMSAGLKITNLCYVSIAITIKHTEGSYEILGDVICVVGACVLTQSLNTPHPLQELRFINQAISCHRYLQYLNWI